MNPYVQLILSLLNETRGLVATAVTTKGTDGRQYVQVLGVPGFPGFTIKPRGACELPFEHSYNKARVPDREVIRGKVLKLFGNEFRQFCWSSTPPYVIGDTPIFYRNYMRWGAALFGTARSKVMEVFSEWLAEQPGAKLSKRQFDPAHLFSTAYEFIIIGAYADNN